MKVTDKVSDDRLRAMFAHACDMHAMAIALGWSALTKDLWAERASVLSELLSARTALLAHAVADCEVA